MKFKAFGRANHESDDGLLTLSEVSFAGRPEELRRVAQLLEKGAAQLEEYGARFGHIHLRDEKDLRPWIDGATDVIVANTLIPKANSAPNQSKDPAA